MLSLVVYVLIALIYCEVALLFFEQKRYARQGILAAVTVCVLFALWSWFETPWQVFPDRRMASSLLGLWTVAIPVAVLSVLALGASKLRRPSLRHLAVFLLCPIIVYLYPWFALISVCVSGLDCI
jgi:hypothetical protein